MFVRGVCDVIHAVGVGSERVKGGVRRIIGRKVFLSLGGERVVKLVCVSWVGRNAISTYRRLGLAGPLVVVGVWLVLVLVGRTHTVRGFRGLWAFWTPLRMRGFVMTDDVWVD